MVGLLITIVGVLGVGGALLYALARLADQRGESPIAWMLGLALVWGFVWVIMRTARLLLGPQNSILYQRWYPWVIAGAALLCLMTFALYWYLLDNRIRDKEMEDKVEEIGKT